MWLCVCVSVWSQGLHHGYREAFDTEERDAAAVCPDFQRGENLTHNLTCNINPLNRNLTSSPPHYCLLLILSPSSPQTLFYVVNVLLCITDDYSMV